MIGETPSPDPTVSAGVFVSYSRVDLGFVRRLQGALEAVGRRVWVDLDDLPAASRFRDELREAIEAADVFVFVLSPDSVRSVECAREREHALALNKRLVPVHARRVDPAEVPESLSLLNWIPQVGLPCRWQFRLPGR